MKQAIWDVSVEMVLKVVQVCKCPSTVPATGDLGHLCAHELQHSARERLIVGGVMAQLATGAVPKREQTSILVPPHRGIRSHTQTHTDTHKIEILKHRPLGQNMESNV